MSRRPLVVMAVVAASLVAASCGGGTSGGDGGDTKPPVRPSARPTASRPIDPNFDTGQTVLITPGGFHPKILVAEFGKDVVWKNTTTTTQEVVFTNGMDRSGPIEPGASFTFHPEVAVAYAYYDPHDRSRKGFVQVEPTDINDTLPPQP